MINNDACTRHRICEPLYYPIKGVVDIIMKFCCHCDYKYDIFSSTRLHKASAPLGNSVPIVGNSHVSFNPRSCNLKFHDDYISKHQLHLMQCPPSMVGVPTIATCGANNQWVNLPVCVPTNVQPSAKVNSTSTSSPPSTPANSTKNAVCTSVYHATCRFTSGCGTSCIMSISCHLYMFCT